MNEASNTLGKFASADAVRKRALFALLTVAFVLSFSLFNAPLAYAVDVNQESQAIEQQVSPGDQSQAIADSQQASINASEKQAPEPEGAVTEEYIADEDNPLALIPTPGYWSLVDVLAAIASVFAALALFVNAMRTSCADERQRIRQLKHSHTRDARTPLSVLVFGLAVAAASASAVLVTQDFAERMALFDMWTPFFVAGTVVNVVLVLADLRCRRDADDDTSAPAIASC